MRRLVLSLLTISGGGPLTIANGGTGATTAANARTNLAAAYRGNIAAEPTSITENGLYRRTDSPGLYLGLYWDTDYKVFLGHLHGDTELFFNTASNSTWGTKRGLVHHTYNTAVGAANLPVYVNSTGNVSTITDLKTNSVLLPFNTDSIIWRNDSYDVSQRIIGYVNDGASSHLVFRLHTSRANNVYEDYWFRTGGDFTQKILYTNSSGNNGYVVMANSAMTVSGYTVKGAVYN